MSYSYAILGQSCQTSMDMLVDNKKFFPMDAPVYDVLFTKMQRYPATSTELPPISPDLEKPEDIKTAKHKPRKEENFSSCNSCKR